MGGNLRIIDSKLSRKKEAFNKYNGYLLKRLMHCTEREE